MLGLSATGTVYLLGTGEQFQLGRRVLGRQWFGALIPRAIGPKQVRQIKFISAGSYHSFAIGDDHKVWAWGLNQYGQYGIDPVGQYKDCVQAPTIVNHLFGYKIVQIAAEDRHGAVVTADGQLLVWGRNDYHQLGVELPANDIGKVTRRYSALPIHIMNNHTISYIACGSHC